MMNFELRFKSQKEKDEKKYKQLRKHYLYDQGGVGIRHWKLEAFAMSRLSVMLEPLSPLPSDTFENNLFRKETEKE